MTVLAVVSAASAAPLPDGLTPTRCRLSIAARGATYTRRRRDGCADGEAHKATDWTLAMVGGTLQKFKLAEAIRYALSRWEGLTRFLNDGRVEIDTNVVERAIRPIALNRRTLSSPAPMAAASIGLSSLAGSRPANSSALNHTPTWPTSSRRSSTSIRTVASTNSSPGSMLPRRPSRTWPESAA